jgi:hypothetical protein
MLPRVTLVVFCPLPGPGRSRGSRLSELNHLLQDQDLLILVVEVLHHSFDVCVRLHGRRIGLIRLKF